MQQDTNYTCLVCRARSCLSLIPIPPSLFPEFEHNLCFLSTNEDSSKYSVSLEFGSLEECCFFFFIPILYSITSYAGAQTAWDMLHEEDLSRRITTSCADLDKILGGGIACKEVTEIG